MQRVRAEFIRQIIKTACASAETLSKRAKMRRGEFNPARLSSYIDLQPTLITTAKSDIKVVNRATLKQNAVPTKLPVQKPLKIVSIAPAERASNDKPEAKEKPNTGSTDFSALEEEVLELTKKRGSVRQSRRLTQRSMSSEPTTSKMLDKIEPIYENPTHEVRSSAALHDHLESNLLHHPFAEYYSRRGRRNGSTLGICKIGPRLTT